MLTRTLLWICLVAADGFQPIGAVRLRLDRPPSSELSSSQETDFMSPRYPSSLPSPPLGEPRASDVRHVVRHMNAAVLSLGVGVFHKVKAVVLYKPPVGIVAAYVIFRLVSSGRLFRLDTTETSEKALDRSSKRRARKSGRSLDLDKDDMMYQESGGVERVRQRLCWAAVSALLAQTEGGDENADNSGKSPSDTLIRVSGGAAQSPRQNQNQNQNQTNSIIQSDRINGKIDSPYLAWLARTRSKGDDMLAKAFSPPPAKENENLPPKDSQGKVYEMAKSIENKESTRLVLKAAVDVLAVSCVPGGPRTQFVEKLVGPLGKLENLMETHRDRKGSITGSKEADKIIRIAAVTAEIRTLDAMLRMARDRILRTTFRLSRTERHWRRRVKYARSRNKLLQKVLRETFEGDQLRLAFAEAATKEEMIRLGEVADVLLQRPAEMDDSCLTEAVRVSVQMEQDHDQKHEASSVFIRRRPKDDTTPNKSSRFRFWLSTEGKGFLSLRAYDDKMSVSGKSAIDVLLARNDTDEWLGKAEAWTATAKKEIHTIVKQSLGKSIDPIAGMKTRIDELETSWCSPSRIEGEDVERQWYDMFELTRDAQDFRRVGEGRTIRLREATFIQWARQWDLLGIPSAAFKVLLAYAAHVYLKPFWPAVAVNIQESYEIVLGIIQKRFYEPIRDIVYEVMNKGSASLLEDITSADEEVSLDNMLRDLGFGDGTPATRHEAIQKASRQYENDMDNGLIRHAIGGRLIRLILIQVQQLKVGMLNAAENIDVLLQANRFNIQLLAIIPAIVILTVSTQIFIKALFHLRSKDLRPIGSVHSEMAICLEDLESVLLLADRKPNVGDGSSPSPSAKSVLTSEELGKFVFLMHSYLVLLDFSSPPLPSRSCDSIHKSFQEFLGSSGSLQNLGIQQHLALIGQLKSKHSALKKHL